MGRAERILIVGGGIGGLSLATALTSVAFVPSLSSVARSGAQPGRE